MILSWCQWIQSTAFFTALRGSSYVYPAILSLHVLGIAIFGAMVLMTNMRLLGLAMRNRSVPDVLGQFRNPKRIGLILIAACGILLLGSKAEEYYYNSFFRIKMLLLALIFIHGWMFRGRVYCNATETDLAGDRVPGIAKLAAVVSLLLWIGIACAGRGIGYIEPPLDKLHARLFPMVVKETGVDNLVFIHADQGEVAQVRIEIRIGAAPIVLAESMAAIDDDVSVRVQRIREDQHRRMCCGHPRYVLRE